MWSVRMMAPDLRIGSNGKGPTRAEAVASAYCELVERISIGMLCGVFLAPYRQLHGPFSDIITEVEQFRYMPGYSWGHQDSFMNVLRVEDLLRDVKCTNGQLESLKMNSEFLRHWVPGYSLISEKEVMVPPLFMKWISATNGIASGNTIEEAIVHACCEIFERDALIKYLRHMNSTPPGTVLPETIEDHRILSILDYFKRNNVEVIIKNIGYDMYPVMAILTFNHNMPKNQLGMNFIKAGSAFSATDALLRCFTERMQGTTFDAEAKMLADDVLELDQKYMPVMFSGVCPFDLSPFKNDGHSVHFVDWEENDTAKEIGLCKKIASTFGTDLIVVDHTHPMIGLPTVRVIMPGLSDFMKWWDPSKLTVDFIGNIQREEDVYESKLAHLLKTFRRPRFNASTASNIHRRDV